jgi:hypothetical protein
MRPINRRRPTDSPLAVKQALDSNQPLGQPNSALRVHRTLSLRPGLHPNSALKVHRTRSLLSGL